MPLLLKTKNNCFGCHAKEQLFFVIKTYLVYKTYQCYHEQIHLDEILICNILHKHHPFLKGTTVPTGIF